MGSSEGQTYCLRWNNHKSNLVEILDMLIKMECYVDVTIHVDDGVQFKAHRVILAASSPYFQAILQDVPMDHCMVLFPGVKAFEMRALLEYMYTGEVNVTQSQIPRIMKIAEQLEVKGLFDMTELRRRFEHIQEQPVEPEEARQSPPIISTSMNHVSSAAHSSVASPPYGSYKSPYSSIFARSPVLERDRERDRDREKDRERERERERIERHPVIPWGALSNPPLPSPLPPHALHTAAAAMLSSVYESAADMNPLKRKKLSSISSMLMSRDTPILRNVLAQTNVADSSQPVSLVCQSIKHERERIHSNGSAHDSEKHMKPEEAHSPFADKSYEEDHRDGASMHSSTSPPQNYSLSSDMRNGIAPYVPQQKPEWKRYKQYSRNDIMCAIECVRNGMSALQASRKYNVPSRTLYDKVKKLGITTNRPMNRTFKRGSGGGSTAFPYGLSGTGSSYGGHSEGEESHMPPMAAGVQPMPYPAAALLDAAFLQQALEGRGGDALHALATAAQNAHAAANGMSTSPGNHGDARSPSPNLHPHAPGVLKYMKMEETVPEQNTEEDEVEDLSMGRKETEHQQTGSVIVAPSLSAMLKNESVIRPEMRREISHCEDGDRD